MHCRPKTTPLCPLYPIPDRAVRQAQQGSAILPFVSRPVTGMLQKGQLTGPTDPTTSRRQGHFALNGACHYCSPLSASQCRGTPRSGKELPATLAQRRVQIFKHVHVPHHLKRMPTLHHRLRDPGAEMPNRAPVSRRCATQGRRRIRGRSLSGVDPGPRDGDEDLAGAMRARDGACGVVPGGFGVLRGGVDEPREAGRGVADWGA